MKKSNIIYSVIAMASVMACNKLETKGQIGQENSNSVIYATSETTKTTITDTGIRQVEWLEGDEAMVYNTSGTGKKYTAQNSGSTAKFVSADGLNGDYCAAVYPASLAKGCDNGPIITAEVPSQQDGDFRNLVFAGVPKASGSNQFLFTAVTSIIKINVPLEKDIVKIEVVSDNICGQFTATYSNNKWTTANGDNLGNTITITAEQGHTLPETVYIAVLPTSSNPEITIKGYKSTDSSDSPFYNKTASLTTTLKANVLENFGTIQKRVQDPKGFTIDAEGHQVFIAPGNLQYQASTGTWRFAEHQWDFVGDSTNGTVYEGSKKCDNSSMSKDYSGWIDQFGFGTSGYNGIMPYNTSSDGFALAEANLLLTEFWNYDWGRYCYISNDPYKDDTKEAKKWHVMTREQWKYLLGNANRNWCKAIVYYESTAGNSGKSVTGNFILPDIFVKPEGITYTLGNNDNKFNKTQFESMVQQGAVFLPFCSFYGDGQDYAKLGRYHTNLIGDGQSPSINGPIDISSGNTSGCGTNGAFSPNQRCSVRLVRDVPTE